MKMFLVVRRTCRNIYTREQILNGKPNMEVWEQEQAGWWAVGVSQFLFIAVFPYLIRSKSKANAHIADEAHDYDQAVHNYQYGGWCGVQSMQKILQANEYTIKCLT